MTMLSVLVLLALGLMGTLGLFVNLKLEVEKRSQRERARVEAIMARLVEAEGRLAPPALASTEENIEQIATIPRSGLNLSKRVQVTRLLREGKDSAQIAVELGMSRGEVQLLASVHDRWSQQGLPEPSKLGRYASCRRHIATCATTSWATPDYLYPSCAWAQ